MGLNFSTSATDFDNIERIVTRAAAISRRIRARDIDYLALTMDITACHLNGNPLRLAELADADDETFTHDVFGIVRHIDRRTGALKDCFVPRLSLVGC